MTDFFKKLNLLLRTNLPDLPLGSEPSTTPPRLGKNVDREIAALNDRVRDAYAYEEQLKTRIDTLDADVLRLDQAADDALAEGREEQARYHIEHLKRSQARLEMTRADLREHQRVTAELVQRVAELEDAVARAREAQATPPQPPANRPSLEDALRGTRETLEADEALAPPARDNVPAARPKPATSDDLDDRIRRLSK
jgi:chromosome segregation ATPase